MKTTVVYHSADFDGIFCREIARKFLPPDTEFIGWNFGDTPLKIPDGMLYVLDLPCDRPFGFCFDKSATEFLGRYLIWIDHHKTSMEIAPQYIPGYRIDGVAACRLAWQWFSFEGKIPVDLQWATPFKERKVSEPIAVRLAGEYDVFDKRDVRADLFQFGLKSQALTDEVWICLLNDQYQYRKFEEQGVDKLLNQGKPLQYARGVEYAEVITKQGFTVQFEGLTFLACNSHELDIRSQLFEAGIKPEHDALLGFTFNGKSWRVSLYGVPGKPDIDLTPIAKKYKGGGHCQACGFHVTSLDAIFSNI